MPGSTNCHRRLRDRLNSGDIQLQQNISRPRAQRQIVVNENEPLDLQLQASVSGITGLGESASCVGGDNGFGSVPEFRLESDIAMDIGDMLLTGQDMPDNQNFVLASESSSSYRCSQDSRDNEYVRVKSEAASVPALNRTKNPRSLLSKASESQQNFATACDPTATTTDQKPQQ
jgi:hypothetical protein